MFSVIRLNLKFLFLVTWKDLNVSYLYSSTAIEQHTLFKSIYVIVKKELMWPNNKSTWSADEQFAYNCECIKYWKACKNWSNSKSKSIYMQSDKGPVKSLQKWKRCNPRPSRWDRADLLLALSRAHQYYYKIYFTLFFFFFHIVWKNFLSSPDFSLSPAVSFLFPYLVKLFGRKQLFISFNDLVQNSWVHTAHSSSTLFWPRED